MDDIRTETDAAIENCIEWLRGQERVTITLSQKRYINKILKLKEKYPNDVEIQMLPEENDGYLLCKIPLPWIKISHREVSEEQKEVMRERMKNYWNK